MQPTSIDLERFEDWRSRGIGRRAEEKQKLAESSLFFFSELVKGFNPVHKQFDATRLKFDPTYLLRFQLRSEFDLFSL